MSVTTYECAEKQREMERERMKYTHTHAEWDFLLILALISYNSQLKILDATHRGICCCSLFLYVFFLFLNHDALVLFGHLLYSFLIHIEVGPRFYTLNCSIDTSTWVVKFCQKRIKIPMVYSHPVMVECKVHLGGESILLVLLYQ